MDEKEAHGSDMSENQEATNPTAQSGSSTTKGLEKAFHYSGLPRIKNILADAWGRKQRSFIWGLKHYL